MQQIQAPAGASQQQLAIRLSALHRTQQQQEQHIKQRTMKTMPSYSSKASVQVYQAYWLKSKSVMCLLLYFLQRNKLLQRFLQLYIANSPRSVCVVCIECSVDMLCKPACHQLVANVGKQLTWCPVCTGVCFLESADFTSWLCKTMPSSH